MVAAPTRTVGAVRVAGHSLLVASWSSSLCSIEAPLGSGGALSVLAVELDWLPACCRGSSAPGALAAPLVRSDWLVAGVVVGVEWEAFLW